MRIVRLKFPRAAWLGLLALGLAGCTSKVDPVFIANLPPEVRLTAAPVSTQDRYFYAYRMNWMGYDPDGRVSHFLIAIDPARPDSVDPSWQMTTRNEEVVFFRASTEDSVQAGFAQDFHVFAIAAVDEQGLVSKPVYRAFFSYTEAPKVFIEAPTPNEFFPPIVTPVVRIRWRGIDPDGVFTTKPVKYKFQLFRAFNQDFPSVIDFVNLVWSNPRVLNWFYAPTFGPSPKCPTCTPWESTSAETTEKQYFNLIPNQLYVFAVTAIDEAGAYDPVFDRGRNLLKFAVTFAGTLGPRLCMWNEFFFFCYQSGGYANDPTRYFNVEVPVDQPVTFNWIAFAPEGADMRRYRWALDLQDLTNEDPRTNEQTDWYHWSAYSLQNISATIGPFRNAPEDHLFFIEAEDNNGLRSLGIIRFTVVRSTFEKSVLFVDDTRLTPDRFPGGVLEAPKGTWPSAAELDTFLFATGGKPWRGYPTGSLTSPGIFSAWGPFGSAFLPSPYAYDTLGTRGILNGLVPLAVLGRYKMVVWYTDDLSATYDKNPFDLVTPTTSLRLMSTPGQPSTISTYLKQGGKVWMMGGGAAYATLAVWNRSNTQVDEFTNADGELVPGRFMYDFPHWRSAVTTRPASHALINTPAWAPQYNGSGQIGRGWSAHGMERNLNQPNYAKLTSDPVMEMLSPRSCSTDPPSPARLCNSLYLVTGYSAEYIGRSPRTGGRADNHILEDADPNPDVLREESTLDTLYLCLGGSAIPLSPIMTYYHGFQNPPLVFCGFPLWYFQRAQVQKLADFVMEDIFGFTKPAVPGGGAAAAKTFRAPSGEALQPLGDRRAATALRR